MHEGKLHDTNVSNSNGLSLCLQTITFLNPECPDDVQCEFDVPDDFPDEVHLARLVRVSALKRHVGVESIHRYNMQARKCFLLARTHMDKKNYEKALELLEVAPDLGPLLHVPEVDTISLVSPFA